MSKYDLTVTSFPAYSNHGGTGLIMNAKNLVQPWTVDRDVQTQLGFEFRRYSIRVMSFEISTSEAPNWFGVSFRSDINTFDSVNIFCHPSPGTAGMTDRDYPTRSGNWPSLFRYAEMLGAQMDAALSNQIVIVPFFNNASYTSTGLFGPNWASIVSDILQAARTEALQRSDDGLVTLKHVVLSNFSFGRHLMRNIRVRAPGLDSYLREIWDFDGVGTVPPYTSGGVRGIVYDQQLVRDVRSFHVPPQRWMDFHHKVVPSVHSNIPDMLAWHAASISSVGKIESP